MRICVSVREEEFWLQKKHDQRGELYGREPEPVVSRYPLTEGGGERGREGG